MDTIKISLIFTLTFLVTALHSQDQWFTEAKTFQETLNHDYADEEHSIFSEEERKRFEELGGHPFFEIDSQYRILADFEVFEVPNNIEMNTSSERMANYVEYGKASFDLNGKKHSLFVYRPADPRILKMDPDGLFIPFTDLNAGELTYGGGRYLDVKIPEDKTKLLLDFNQCYQPYCAYTSGYSCPIPPVENALDTYIDAGVKHLDLDQLNADELLNKSIAFHDPNDQWGNFKATLDFLMIMADSSERTRQVFIDNKNQEFKFTGIYKEGELEYKVKNDQPGALWNGKPEIPEDAAKEYRISVDRALLYRNYYTYLYGMPMKLKDPGTQIEKEIKRVRFKGSLYDRMRVTYDPEVGADIWYFYFNPDTHALEAYQFFKDESKNDGEYILFEELKEIEGVKIPKIRHWYYNSDGGFLATDVLK